MHHAAGIDQLPATSGQSRPSALWETFIVDQERLKRALLVKGWSLANWAQQATVSTTTASRFLRQLPVTAASAYHLIKALGLEPEDLIVARPPSDGAGAVVGSTNGSSIPHPGD